MPALFGLFALSGPAFALRTIPVGGEYTVQAVEQARELGLIEYHETTSFILIGLHLYVVRFCFMGRTLQAHEKEP